ncbi:glycosyltransferase family protein [Neolewinella antarctica]|uniref:Spore protein YkvP/CgeB glycosyl transferase-like domain-containing protein n=1 Tax=Neolewinella antarctica TaxID=442734 RepID=A0ABX0XB31_9BACT|nr:glycosyltransferase [Neolewinella antarctica]NJC26143.1 hypothetical protein [Neolewinella antarctica]
MKKLIKFDIIHPAAWLADKKAEHPEVKEMSLEEYRAWLLGLFSNYSDFYTHYLTESGEWDAEEYFLLDDLYNLKVAQHLYGKERGLAMDVAAKVYYKLRRRGPGQWRSHLIKKYIQSFKPDVIFVRSQPQNSKFWLQFRKDALLVARLSARLPQNWHPEHFDLIYTDQPDFQTFFHFHGVKTVLNDQGFDPRIIDHLQSGRPSPGVVFCGGLGTQNFLARTEFFERIAQRAKFSWWGYWWEYGGDGRALKDFPALHAGFNGPTSGLEMYQIYHDADICLNDYVDTANGIGFNQRMFEVMGSGGFLLTRMAPNFAEQFPEGIFATYVDDEDCLRQVDHYLAHPEERAVIAKKGQAYIVENYNYERISKEFADDLLVELAAKDKA